MRAVDDSVEPGLDASSLNTLVRRLAAKTGQTCLQVPLQAWDPPPKLGTMSSHKSHHKTPANEPEPNPYELSSLSTRAVEPTRWSSADFVLAAGLCILQPSTGRVVLVTIGNQEVKNGRWFLPRGRKDIGESLEQTALREGYEVRHAPLSMSQRVNLEVTNMVGEWVSSRIPADPSISPTTVQPRTQDKDQKPE